MTSRMSRRAARGCGVLLAAALLLATCSGSAGAAIRRHRIVLGTAVGWSYLQQDPRYAALIARYFGSVTPENVMKRAIVEPSQGRYDFSGADGIVDWALAHNKAVHGHVLVWDAQQPWWLTRGAWTRAQLMSFEQSYVSRMVARYRGRVAEWDVVNEAFDGEGRYKQNFWYRAIGPQYIELAYRWARAADPQAKLFYNDGGGAGTPAMVDAWYRMVRDFKHRHVPIDGIGLEIHSTTAIYTPTSVLVKEMRRLAGLGVEVDISEMDVETSFTPGTLAHKLAAEARVFRDAAGACQRVLACKRLTVWGAMDTYSWRGAAELPLLFDSNYRPKPAWHAVAGELH